MKWYGQFEPQTDSVAFSYFPKNYIGFAIDVGASDGEIISNTKAFEDAGWKVLCIEPNPEFWDILTKNRKHCQQYAVSNRNGISLLTVFNGPGSGSDAVTSINPDYRLVTQYGVTPVKCVPVQTRTLDDCINELGGVKDIDYVSIDTEGTELDVLKGFAIDTWKPKLIIVENNYNDECIHDYMNLHSYRMDRKIVVNEFYVPLS